MKRFWGKVKKTDNCWIWKAGIRSLKTGYGCFKYQGKVVDAHRMSWFLFFGNIPEGKCVLHHCDNRLCVNPKHLFIGSKKDNVIDAIKKKRFDFIHLKKSQFRTGKRSKMAKLTKEIAEEIRNLYINTNTTYRKLGKKYNVSKQTICDAIRGTFHY